MRSIQRKQASWRGPIIFGVVLVTVIVLVCTATYFASRSSGGYTAVKLQPAREKFCADQGGHAADGRGKSDAQHDADAEIGGGFFLGFGAALAFPDHFDDGQANYVFCSLFGTLGKYSAF